jgi:hypothetical protein
MGNESYLHKYAKQTLASWLRRKRSGKLKWILEDITLSSWNDNKSKTIGVCIEYPLVKISGGEYKGHTISWDNKIPTYYQLKQDNIKPEFMFDIAVINNSGNIESVFEIEFKSPMTQKKIKFLNDHNIKYYEVSALDIMTNCRPPKQLFKE